MLNFQSLVLPLSFFLNVSLTSPATQGFELAPPPAAPAVVAHIPNTPSTGTAATLATALATPQPGAQIPAAVAAAQPPPSAAQVIRGTGPTRKRMQRDRPVQDAEPCFRCQR